MKAFRKIDRYLKYHFSTIKKTSETIIYLNSENNVVAIKERDIIVMRFINDNNDHTDLDKNPGITVCICKHMQFPVMSQVYVSDLLFLFDTRKAHHRVIGGGTTDLAPIGVFNSNNKTLKCFDNSFSICGLKRSTKNGIVCPCDPTVYSYYFSTPLLDKSITVDQAIKKLKKMEHENECEINELENLNIIPHYWREQLSSFYNFLYEYPYGDLEPVILERN